MSYGLRVLLTDGATKGNTGAEDFFAGTVKLNSVRLLSISHGVGNLDDVIEANVSVVQNVLNLLSIPWWFLQSLNDQGRGGWEHLDCALSVLHSNLNFDFHTSPLGSGLLDIFTDFLGWETNWTTFGSEGVCTLLFRCSKRFLAASIASLCSLICSSLSSATCSRVIFPASLVSFSSAIFILFSLHSLLFACSFLSSCIFAFIFDVIFLLSIWGD